MCLLTDELGDYLDDAGRLVAWPCGRKIQSLALEYLASKFETGQSYSLLEVNAIINRHHVFDQATMLRFQLFENGLLDATSDGTEFWKIGP